MTILGDPQARPSTVTALTRTLASLPKQSAEVSELIRWMMPTSGPGIPNSLKATLKVAEQLHLIRRLGSEKTNWKANSVCELTERWQEPPSYEQVMDRVHDSMVGNHPTSPSRVLRVFAALVARIEDEGFYWLHQKSSEKFASLCKEKTTGLKGFNATQMTPWGDWTSALGLGMSLSGKSYQFLPHPAERLRRVLHSYVEETGSKTINGEEFKTLLATTLPYLHGEIWKEVAKEIGIRPEPNRLNRVLSTALISLHKRSHIELVPARVDDRKNLVILAPQSRGPSDSDLPDQIIAVTVCRGLL